MDSNFERHSDNSYQPKGAFFLAYCFLLEFYYQSFGLLRKLLIKLALWAELMPFQFWKQLPI
jgi:hypothetical protein